MKLSLFAVFAATYIAGIQSLPFDDATDAAIDDAIANMERDLDAVSSLPVPSSIATLPVTTISLPMPTQTAVFSTVYTATSTALAETQIPQPPVSETAIIMTSATSAVAVPTSGDESQTFPGEGSTDDSSPSSSSSGNTSESVPDESSASSSSSSSNGEDSASSASTSDSSVPVPPESEKDTDPEAPEAASAGASANSSHTSGLLGAAVFAVAGVSAAAAYGLYRKRQNSGASSGNVFDMSSYRRNSRRPSNNGFMSLQNEDDDKNI